MDGCCRNKEGRHRSKDVSSNDSNMFPAYLTLRGSEFQRVGVATEKALVLIIVSTSGRKYDYNSRQFVYSYL